LAEQSEIRQRLQTSLEHLDSILAIFADLATYQVQQVATRQEPNVSFRLLALGSSVCFSCCPNTSSCSRSLFEEQDYFNSMFWFFYFFNAFGMESLNCCAVRLLTSRAIGAEVFGGEL
jgi:hypothetical protein